MIKHRFILRGEDDFKIFAAIPCESTVLVWERWTRPPDWETLKSTVETAISGLSSASHAFLMIAESSARLLRACHAVDAPTQAVTELTDRMAAHIEWATGAYERVESDITRLRSITAVLPPPEAERTLALFERAVGLFADDLAHNVDPDDAIGKLRRSYDAHITTLESGRVRAIRTEHNELVKELRGAFKQMVVHLGLVENTLKLRRQVAQEVRDVLLGCDPLPDTPCPSGVPFAAYTVEFGSTVVNVVEGKAWVTEVRTEAQVEVVKGQIDQALGPLSKDEARAVLQELREKLATAPRKPPRDAAPDEKRVVEIVTQMLVERNLNPKADTRVPVREVDPAKAHQTRETERRDPTPRVRTIKFEVSPPRYLREAAERILSSPRRAHWVIGHWRNQPYGEKRAQHKQLWIKPHIRGLGEASATLAAVVAPRVERAT